MTKGVVIKGILVAAVAVFTVGYGSSFADEDVWGPLGGECEFVISAQEMNPGPDEEWIDGWWVFEVNVVGCEHSGDYLWRFGDGESEFGPPNSYPNQDISNYGAIMTHQYLEPGTYTVEVWVSIPRADAEQPYDQWDFESYSGYIDITVEMPVPEVRASFAVSGRSYGGLLVYFENTSEGESLWSKEFEWSWGDGATTTTWGPADAEHWYHAEGDYEVTLTVLDPSIELEHPYDMHPYSRVTETVHAGGCLAAFSYGIPDVDETTVQFIDKSTTDATITHWEWEFGDVTYHSTDQNPSHTYMTGGPGTWSTYSRTVTLTIATSSGCSDTVGREVHLIASEFDYDPYAP